MVKNENKRVKLDVFGINCYFLIAYSYATGCLALSFIVTHAPYGLTFSPNLKYLSDN
jgi:hypothetical protein